MKGPKSSDGYAPVRRTYWVFSEILKRKLCSLLQKKLKLKLKTNKIPPKKYGIGLYIFSIMAMMCLYQVGLRSPSASSSRHLFPVPYREDFSPLLRIPES